MTEMGLAREFELSQKILKLISVEAMEDSRVAKNVADFHLQLVIEWGEQHRRLAKTCKRLSEK